MIDHYVYSGKEKDKSRKGTKENNPVETLKDRGVEEIQV